MTSIKIEREKLAFDLEKVSFCNPFKVTVDLHIAIKYWVYWNILEFLSATQLDAQNSLQLDAQNGA